MDSEEDAISTVRQVIRIDRQSHSRGFNSSGGNAHDQRDQRYILVADIVDPVAPKGVGYTSHADVIAGSILAANELLCAVDLRCERDEGLPIKVPEVQRFHIG